MKFSSVLPYRIIPAKALLFILASYFMLETATADLNNGTRLLIDCKNYLRIHDSVQRYSSIHLPLLDAVQAGMCVGLITGIIGTETRYAAAQRPRLICPPDDISRAQGVMVVTQYLNENPRELHRPGYALAFEALYEAYPCSQ